MATEIIEINKLDQASALDGTELFELEQASKSVKDSLASIATYISDIAFAETIDYLELFFDFGSDELTILADLIVNGNFTVLGNTNLSLPSFDSGWLLNEMGGPGVADWTNVHLGNDPTDPTDNLTHNLDAPLSELIVKVLISTDGTDANSFEVYAGNDNVADRGYTIFEVDTNNIIIQTGAQGLSYPADADGVTSGISANDWYYKIKVWKLG